MRVNTMMRSGDNLRSSNYVDPVGPAQRTARIEMMGPPMESDEHMIAEHILIRARFWGGFMQAVYALFTLVSLWFTYWFPIMGAILSGYTVFASFTHFRSVTAFTYTRTCGSSSSFSVLKYVSFFQYTLIIHGFIQLFVSIYVTVANDDHVMIFGIIGIICGFAIVPIAALTAKSCKEIEQYVVPLAVSALSRNDPSMIDEDFVPRGRSLSGISYGGGTPSAPRVVGTRGAPMTSPDDGYRLTDHHKPPFEMQSGWTAPNPRETYANDPPSVRSALKSSGGRSPMTTPSMGRPPRNVTTRSVSMQPLSNPYDDFESIPSANRYAESDMEDRDVFNRYSANRRSNAGVGFASPPPTQPPPQKTVSFKSSPPPTANFAFSNSRNAPSAPVPPPVAFPRSDSMGAVGGTYRQ